MSVTAPSPATDWLTRHTDTLRRLQTESNLAQWEAATIGSEEAIRRSTEARAAVRSLYSDPAEAARVKSLLVAPEVTDAGEKRQLTLVDLAYTGNQLAPETIDALSRREGELERVFYTFRAPFEGGRASNNELLEVLRTEKSETRRRCAWEASKLVGREVAAPLRDLIRERNRAARSLGFESWYSMELALQEIDESALFELFDDFRAETDRPFHELRSEMDRSLADRFSLSVDELYPWHWEDFFSQSSPALGEVALDPLFRDRNPVEIARRYFESIGLPVDDVLARSDLYERDVKDQHAFATDIDREGDVRILCNMRADERWMSTLLHELGHAVYDAYLPRTLPYLLRTPAHTLSTEAVAMLMGRLTRDPEWLRSAGGLSLAPGTDDDIRRQQRTSLLVSARWILVMVYFERELYRNPDREDLNSLWWDLVEELQLVRRPPGRDEPDWASKIHFTIAPVYYHNYLLGELMASQLGEAMRKTAAGDESPPPVGRFLQERLFALGASLHWNEALASATGETLSTDTFIREFVSPV